MAGDTVALTVLLPELESRLRRRLTPKIPPDLRSTIDTDDLLQKVYTDAFRGITAFEP